MSPAPGGPIYHLCLGLDLPEHILDSPLFFLTFDSASLGAYATGPASAELLQARDWSKNVAMRLGLPEGAAPKRPPERLERLAQEGFCAWLVDAVALILSPSGLRIYDVEIDSSALSNNEHAGCLARVGFGPAAIESGEPPSVELCAESLRLGLEELARRLGLPSFCLARQDPSDSRAPSLMLPELALAFRAGQEREALSDSARPARRSSRSGL